MSLRAAVYDLLNDVEADVYPVFAPQQTTDPYVVYTISTSPVRDQFGINMKELDLTLHIYASEFDDCVSLASSLYSGLEGASGSYGSETLRICNWESESDGYVPDLDKVIITQTYNLKFD